ncbi:MAG: hypothetical protein PHC84_02305 [Clostridia bacterium]|nr:hypothetical protein [Clostridia bacterium]
MKKHTLIALLLIALMLFVFAACEKPVGNTDEKSVTLLVVLDGEELGSYERKCALATVADLFNLLANEENSQFAYSSSTSFFGQFVNSVTVSTDSQTWVSVGLFPDASKSQFCAFYHTIDDVNYRDYTVDARTYGEKQYFFSSKGINAVPLIDGASYLVTIDEY